MTDSADVSFHDIRSSGSMFSSQQLSALSLKRPSFGKSPTSSFVLINNKRTWRPPGSVLRSITQYFPRGTPWSFALLTPSIRLFTERTEGIACAGYAVMPCVAGEVYVPAHREGGLVEDDVPRAAGHHGHSTTPYDDEDAEEENPFYLFTCPEAEGGRRYTEASGHRYPYTGYQYPYGRPSPGGPPRKSDQDPFDREISDENEFNTSNGDCVDVVHSSTCTFAARCWRQCGQEDMLFSVSVMCASTKALQLAILNVWWLSRYHNVSLKLVNMCNNDQLTKFSMLRQLLTITDLHCVRCTLTAEWMQSISTCADLTTLSIISCIASKPGVSLVYIDSILSSSVVEGRRGHTKWYLSGTLSIGLLKKLKCLHISCTPLQQEFIEVLGSCTNLVCVLLHRCKGVESLQPLTKLPKLRCFSLQNCSIKDDKVQFLGECTKLRHLHLIECRRMTYLGFLSGIGGSLRLLNLSQNYFSDEHMQQIANCTQLVELHLNSLKRLTNVNHLQPLRQLEVLSLSDNSLVDNGCTALLDMPLSRLDLSRSGNLRSVNNWISLVSQLVSLDLSCSGVKSEGLSALSACKVLRYLNLSECIRLTTIAFVKPLSVLRWLSLARTSLTDDEAQHLSDLILLRYLSLKSCKYLRELDFVENLTTLEYLDLENTSLTDSCIQRLAKCTALKLLNLSRCFSLTDITPLGRMPALKALNLSYTSLTVAGMSRLHECTALEVLYLQSCRQLRSLAGLHSLRNLKRLDLDYFSMVDEMGSSFGTTSRRLSSLSGFTSLQQTFNSQRTVKSDIFSEMLSSSTIGVHSALSRTSSTLGTETSSHNSMILLGDSPKTSLFPPMLFPKDSDAPPSLTLPDLLTFSIRRGVLNDLHLALQLTSSTRLTHLDLSECRHLTTLAGLPPLPQLRAMVAVNAGLTNAALAVVGGYTALERLSVAGCAALTDLSALGRLRRLRVLDASRTHLTDAGLAGLAGCAGLVFLSLGRCAGVTDVAALAALGRLRELHLEGTGVTADGVASLARCPALQRLYLTRCRRLTSIAGLQGALTRLDVLEVYGTAVPHRIAGKPQQVGCTLL
ncbi:unnamed protein product [Phytomonas sp. Hart1]|nr:unnamed protein product [Phytomonas sp. Hart1]|eukprot:CCW69909.1 unnamed protein product [Phytomonas sp. isolate Hart1]